MIAYWAVPYLLVAAPPVIVLLSVLIGGCTMPPPQPATRVRLIGELDRCEEHDELRRIQEAQQ